MTAPTPGWTTHGEVIRVIDGDTVEIQLTRTIRVRLDECWAPESKSDPRIPVEQRAAEKAAGIKSKQALIDKCLGKPCVLHVGTQDDLLGATTLGRVVGRVWVDGVDLSVSQVRDGHATVTKREELG